jgi:hypothetical protein
MVENRYSLMLSYAFNLNLRELLAMAILHHIAFSSLFLEDNNFVALNML